MKKRLLSIIMSLFVMVSLVSVPEQAAVQAEAVPAIKNIIVLIPDGGGYSLYDFANEVKKAGGFNSSLYPYKTPTNTQPMAMRDYLVGSITTHPATGGITDSAAAGTALSTGKKTNNGYLGVDTKQRPIANVLEAAMYKGKAAGLVSTYEWVHATPGAFSAHVSNRSDYYNIYQQIENKGLTVVLGAGYGAVSGYASIQNATDRGYTIIDNKTQLKNVKPGQKIWGNMASSSFPYDINLSSGQATLAEMTSAAITALSGDEDGFFLMVEGSKVDTGGHANDAVVTTSEYLAFDAAFKVAVDFAKGRNDTIVICAPDHETGGLIMPSSATSAVTQVQGGTNPSSLTWTSTNHTAANCGIWMYTPAGVNIIPGLNSQKGDSASTRTDYVVDNTAIAIYIADILGVDMDVLTKEMFVDVTEIGKYMGTTGKFTFNNGNKYTYVNTNKAYVDGTEVNLGFMLPVAVNSRVYVPASLVEPEDWNYVNEDYDGITGTGTADDPYVLDDAYDFIEFTGNMLSGTNYSGKYIRQDADIDLAGNSDYTGIGSGSTFAGVYDGNGHTLNIELTTTGDRCPFPYVTGKIMNLGTTGYIHSTGTYTGGIARSIRAGAYLVNCYSTMEIDGNNVGGLAYSNYGTFSNCYFGGKINKGVPVASTQNGAVYENCYYSSDCGKPQSATTGITAMTAEEMKSGFAKTLTNNREAAAAKVGVEIDKISYWNQETGQMPTFYVPQPTVSKVTVTPASATVCKGDGLQLSATVEGEFSPSQDVIWSIEPESDKGTYIAEDGFLYVSPEEDMSQLVVMAKAQQDGSVTANCKVKISSVVKTEPDGSRARPYLISSAKDLYDFTQNVLGGQKYKGVYFRQTADIDMAGYPGYNGMGNSATFSGTYDGAGHVVNIAISSDTDKCLFPYTNGVIMNLGTTGTVVSGTYSAGICRSVRAGGKMINCWSTVDITGKEMGGIAWSNYGILANCYYAGTRVSTGSNYPLTQTMSGATTYNNYYLGDEYIPAGDVTEITEKELKENLAGWLNEGRDTSAKLEGCALADIMYWLPVQDEGPIHAAKSEEPEIGYANNLAYIYTPFNMNGALLVVAQYDENGKLVKIEKRFVSVDKRTALVQELSQQFGGKGRVSVMLLGRYVPLARASTVNFA